MPAELTGAHAAATGQPAHHASRWWMLRDVGLVLGVFALLGALGGVVWELWWTAPTGVVVEGDWVPDEDGLRGLFDGTGHFVLVALAVGVLAGAACAFFVDRVELLTLATVAVGSVLATWVMLRVGTALAPPDPTALARTAEDGERLLGTLRVIGDGALLSLPAGALAGLVVVFIGLTPTRPPRA